MVLPSFPLRVLQKMIIWSMFIKRHKQNVRKEKQKNQGMTHLTCRWEFSICRHQQTAQRYKCQLFMCHSICHSFFQSILEIIISEMLNSSTTNYNFQRPLPGIHSWDITKCPFISTWIPKSQSVYLAPEHFLSCQLLVSSCFDCKALWPDTMADVQ